MLISKEFYTVYMKLSRPDEIPDEILNNPRFYPYFEQCRGAIDGSLLDAFVASDDMS